MEDLPQLHICNSLTMKNEELNTKYRKLTRKYKELQASFNELKEQLLKIEIEDKVFSSDDHQIYKKEALRKEKVKNEKPKKNSTDKLLSMHNKLLEQLDKENKQSNHQLKKAQRLEAENERLKDEVFHVTQENDFLKKQLSSKDVQIDELSSKAKQAMSTVHTKQIVNLQQEKNNLITENKCLKEENQCLKDELKGLDKGFFDEIEDLKYTLHQSTKLNAQYEKAMKRLCKKFGANYENAFLNKSTELKQR